LGWPRVVPIIGRRDRNIPAASHDGRDHLAAAFVATGAAVVAVPLICFPWFLFVLKKIGNDWK